MKRRNDETTSHGYAVQNAEIKRANATLAARVRELEAQLANAQERQSAQFGRNTARLADVALDAERQTQRVMELEAQLAAVPDYATYYYNFDGWEPVMSFDEWYAATRAPDEPDAPPTVAAIDDEDGDE